MSNCKYCGNESYDRPFCPECGKKYFGIELEVPVTEDNEAKNKELYNDISYQNESTARTHRTCIYCTKNALPGISVCENHYQAYIIKQQNLFAEAIKYKKTYKNNLDFATHYNQSSKYDLSSKNDNFHNKKYLCKNGIKTRSKSERTISDFLTDNNIEHYYEKSLYFTIYDENMKPNNIILKPDFYIPELKYNGIIYKNIFIEHWGIENDPDYDFKKEVKLSIYEQAKITVICTTESDMTNPYISLTKKLKNIKIKTINK